MAAAAVAILQATVEMDHPEIDDEAKDLLKDASMASGEANMKRRRSYSKRPKKKSATSM